MSDAMDMTTPVTRGELRAELERFEDKLDKKFEPRFAQMATKADLAQLATQMATKADLAQMATQMATKAELAQMATQMATKAELAQMAAKAELAETAIKTALAQTATKIELELWGGALLERIKSGEQRLEQRIDRLSEELARHANAICETLTAQIAASAEAYADLPGRVKRLEAAVFTPRRR
jgi:hypothetical protein